MSASFSSRPPAPVASTRQQLDELDALLQRMLELPVNQLEPDAARPRPTRPVPAPTPTPVPAETRPASVEPRIIQEAAAETETDLAPTPAPTPAPLAEHRADDRPSPYMVIATVGPHVQPPTTELQNPIQPLSLGPRLLKPPAAPEEDQPAAAAATPETPAKPATRGDDGWVPLRSSWQPSAHSWQPLAESWQQRKLPAPAPESTPEPVPTPAPEPAPAAAEEAAEATHDPITPGPLAPLPLHAPAPEQMASLPMQPVSLDDLEPPPSLLLSALRSFNQGFETCLAPCGAVGRFLTSGRGRLLLGSLGALCLATAAALAVADRIGWTR